jgi:hypothetical protein
MDSKTDKPLAINLLAEVPKSVDEVKELLLVAPWIYSSIWAGVNGPELEQDYKFYLYKRKPTMPRKPWRFRALFSKNPFTDQTYGLIRDGEPGSGKSMSWGVCCLLGPDEGVLINYGATPDNTSHNYWAYSNWVRLCTAP